MGKQYVSLFGENVKKFRNARGFSQEFLAEKADLDRSYIGGIERGERNPALRTILRLASALDISPQQLFQQLDTDELPKQHLTGHETRHGIRLAFKYDQYDATYDLDNATLSEFQSVITTLQSGLMSSRSRSNTVANSFLYAMVIWPHANPSDIWNFLINRAYCDRNNHPQAHARLNLEQSWKRTSGWALEKILTQHYKEFLERNGIALILENTEHKKHWLEPINDPRLIPDKADIVATYNTQGSERLLGVIHVKASIAERRTDDVPMSQALIEAGFLSILWTLDANPSLSKFLEFPLF